VAKLFINLTKRHKRVIYDTFINAPMVSYGQDYIWCMGKGYKTQHCEDNEAWFLNKRRSKLMITSTQVDTLGVDHEAI
jgi:hypothetical protein